MKKLFALLLVFVLACTAPAPQTPTPAPATETHVTATEQSTGTVPQPELTTPPAEEKTPAPLSTEEKKLDIAPYTQLGCEQLLTAEQFAKACNNQSDNFIVTYKVGTRNCLVNVKSKIDARLTAGVTLTGHLDPTKAMTEFDRRLKVLKLGADKSVGEKAYLFPLLNRETQNFIRGEYIVEVGSDTRLCSKDGLLGVAKIVDAHIG